MGSTTKKKSGFPVSGGASGGWAEPVKKTTRKSRSKAVIDSGGLSGSFQSSHEVSRVSISYGDKKPRKEPKTFNQSNAGADSAEIGAKGTTSALMRLGDGGKADRKLLGAGAASEGRIVLAGERTSLALNESALKEAAKSIGGKAARAAGPAGFGALAVYDGQKAASALFGEDQSSTSRSQKAGRAMAFVGDVMAAAGPLIPRYGAIIAGAGQTISTTGTGLELTGDLSNKVLSKQLQSSVPDSHAAKSTFGILKGVGMVLKAGIWVKEKAGSLAGLRKSIDSWGHRKLSPLLPASWRDDGGDGDTASMFQSAAEKKKQAGVLSLDAKKPGGKSLTADEMGAFLNDPGRAGASEAVVAAMRKASEKRAAAAERQAAKASAAQEAAIKRAAAQEKARMKAVQDAFNRQAKAAKSRGGFKVRRGRKSKGRGKTGGGYDTGD